MSYLSFLVDGTAKTRIRDSITSSERCIMHSMHPISKQADYVPLPNPCVRRQRGKEKVRKWLGAKTGTLVTQNVCPHPCLTSNASLPPLVPLSQGMDGQRRRRSKQRHQQAAISGEKEDESAEIVGRNDVL